MSQPDITSDRELESSHFTQTKVPDSYEGPGPSLEQGTLDAADEGATSAFLSSKPGQLAKISFKTEPTNSQPSYDYGAGVDQPALFSSGGPPGRDQEFIEDAAARSAQAFVDNAGTSSDVINEESGMLVDDCQQDDARLPVGAAMQPVIIHGQLGLSQATAIMGTHLYSTPGSSAVPQLTNVQVTDESILNTLQAEMIAVEVLSQNATSEVPIMSHGGENLQTNTVELLAAHPQAAGLVTTFNLGGQTFQIPLNMLSTLILHGASLLPSDVLQLQTAADLVSQGVDGPVDDSDVGNAVKNDMDDSNDMSGDSRGRYSCDVCGKNYLRSWSYYSHMREHQAIDHVSELDSDKNFCCDQCPRTFSTSSGLKMHILGHTEDRPFLCDQDGCGKAFSNPSSLRVHLRVHQPDKPFMCKFSDCDKAFKTASELARHNFRHTGEKPHKCDQCEKAFVRYDDLRRHYFIHTGEKPFKCDQCDFACIQSFDLVKHKYTHGGDKPYKCDLCMKQFTRPARLKEHMRLHTGEKPYMCNICGKAFTQQTSLKSHQMTHTGEKPFKCSACDKSFTAAADLKSHINNHTGDRPFKCDLCGKDFISAKTLKRHAIVHTGEKPFDCHMCGRKFARASDLKVHMPVHSEDKPHKCPDCDKMFTRISTLKEHLRTHTGQFPFLCVVCKKIFNHRSHLNTHMRVHTGEKPYRCEMCSKDFARKSSLRYHMRVHGLPDEEAKLNVCQKYGDMDSGDLSDLSQDGELDSMEAEEEEESGSVAAAALTMDAQTMAQLSSSGAVIFAHLPSPLIRSQGGAMVALNLSDLHNAEGQVVETLVHLQGLEDQMRQQLEQMGQTSLDGVTISGTEPTSDPVSEQMVVDVSDEADPTRSSAIPATSD